MKAKGRFISALLVVDAFLIAFAYGFNSRSVAVVDPSLPPVKPQSVEAATAKPATAKASPAKVAPVKATPAKTVTSKKTTVPHKTVAKKVSKPILSPKAAAPGGNKKAEKK